MNLCPICRLPSKMGDALTCGKPICQKYLPLFFRKHKQDGRKSIFDNDVYMTASGTW